MLRLVVALAIVVAGAGASFADPEGVEADARAERLAPPLVTAGGEPAAEQILHETRPVLRGYRAFGVPAKVRAGGTVGQSVAMSGPLPRRVPDTVRDGSRAVAWVQSAAGSSPPALTRVRPLKGRPGLEIEAPAAVAAGRRPTIRFRIPPEEPATRIEIEPIEIPPEAVLDVAIAILPEAWDQGSVRFRVAACESDGCEPVWSRDLEPAQATQRGWLDQRIPLNEIAGKRVRLVFETEHVGAS